MSLIQSRGKRPFQLVMWGCGLFLLLTGIAMFVYPGGTRFDPDASGYTFFHNFLSELGFTITRAGVPNRVGAPLFFIALTLAGMGLMLFFVVFVQFYWSKWYLKALSILGSLFGIVSGLAYVGIAFYPCKFTTRTPFAVCIISVSGIFTRGNFLFGGNFSQP